MLLKKKTAVVNGCNRGIGKKASSMEALQLCESMDIGEIG